MSTKNVVLGSLTSVTLAAGAVVGIGMTADASTTTPAPTAAQTTWAVHHFSTLPAGIQRAIERDLREVRTSQDGVARATRAIAADRRAGRSSTADRSALRRAESSLTAGARAYRIDAAAAARYVFTPKAPKTSANTWVLNHISTLPGSTQRLIQRDLREVRTAQDGIARAQRAVATDVRTHRSSTTDRRTLRTVEHTYSTSVAKLDKDVTRVAGSFGC